MAQQQQSDNKMDEGSKSNPTPFISAATAFDAFEESRKWFVPYFQPINEFERIMRNKPHDKIPKELPRVTDGTLAAIIQESPKRVIQQVPTGLARCLAYPEYAKIADIVLRQELMPYYNRMGTMLQKSWNMVSKSMGWGRSTSYSFFTVTNGRLHVDFVIPYVKDVLTEKGKVYAPDSNISSLRSWLQGRDIDAIINREKSLEERFKDYKSDWDLKALADWKMGGASAKPADQQTPAEKEKGGDAGGFELITTFQKGVGAEFYSFSPRFADGKPFRTKVNKDPRGFIPLDHEYCNIDLSNPLGRGVIELSGGIQNLIDQQMQMFQFLTTMMMGPPLQVWGSVNKNSLKFRPNTIWEMGVNQQNRVEPYAVSNHAIQGFPNNYGLLKSQIMNLNSTQDHSIGADAGNPTQSKTQAGVKAAESRLGVNDNYLRKQFEAWFEAQSETALNIHFSEMRGEYKIALKPEDRKELIKTPAAKYLDKRTGELKVPYKEINDVVFHFEVDAGTSEVKEDNENVDKLVQTIELLKGIEQPEIQEKILPLTKVLVKEIGAQGIDEIFPEEQTDEAGNPIEGAQPQQPAMNPQMVMQMIQETLAPVLQQIDAKINEKQQPDEALELIKALKMNFADLPEGARQIVLTHLNMDTDEATPQDRKDDIETLDALKRQEPDDPAMAGDSESEGNGDDAGHADKSNEGSLADEYGAGGNDPLYAPLDDEETQVVALLTQRGFSEDDTEQAIVMKRQGYEVEDIIQTLGAKYARSAA